MESLLEGYLANQLVDVHEKATGQAARLNNRTSDEMQVTARQRIIGAIEAHPAITGAIVLITVTLLTILFTR
jgi:hypothetical protein